MKILKMSVLRICYLFGIAVLLFASCKKENADAIDYSAIDDQIIKDYISKYGLDAKSTPSGLYYVIDIQGKGKAPKGFSDVSVAYRGTLVDGTVFDETTTPIRFSLTQVISGWTEGIQLFNEGGEGMLLIPSHLGYGSSSDRVFLQTRCLFLI